MNVPKRVRASREKAETSFSLSFYALAYPQKVWPRLRVCLFYLKWSGQVNPPQVCPATWSLVGCKYSQVDNQGSHHTFYKSGSGMSSWLDFYFSRKLSIFSCTHWPSVFSVLEFIQALCLLIWMFGFWLSLGVSYCGYQCLLVYIWFANICRYFFYCLDSTFHAQNFLLCPVFFFIYCLYFWYYIHGVLAKCTVVQIIPLLWFLPSILCITL